MKPTFGSAYLDDNLEVTIWKKIVINIRASKNISGLVKVMVTSPAGPEIFS